MQTIIKWLNRPYPFDGSWRDNWRNALFGGLFVFLFLLVFQPFGIRVSDGNLGKAAIIFGYFGLVTAGTLIFAALIMRALPSFFKEDGWVIWKEVFSNILFVMMIGTGNMVLALFIFNNPFNWTTFFVWQKMTFIIGIFPILFSIYTKQQILQKRHLLGADQLNTKITDHPINDDAAIPTVTLQGDNQNELLEILPSALLYLEAADNYVQVYFQKKGATENYMLRSTLKKMEDQLDGHPQFFRCHRTYIVNLNKVNHVSGNAQGYKLHLENSDKLLPVSRSMNEEIVERFK